MARMKRLALLLVGLTASCQSSLGFLCSPGCGSSVLLGVSPTAVTDSLAATAAAQLDTVRVLNEGAGEFSWRAAAVNNSSWLALQPDSGKAGAAFVVRLDPAGLAAGTYRDSVVVDAMEASSQIIVPVTLRVY